MRPMSFQSKFEDVEMSVSVNSQRVPPQSPWQWQSPVPYLFGGLAAMLGLISLALLILACSYWRQSSSDEEDGHNVHEEKESRSGNKVENGPYEEKFLVIMAGEDLRRFLATPALKKCTCGDKEGKTVITHEEKMEEGEEKEKDTGETTTSH